MSRIIGRVVIGVSGSPENLHALRHAVELARHYGATLIAVNAQTPSRRRSLMRYRAGRPGAPWQHAASIILRTAFEEALGGLPLDIECVLLAAPGPAGPALIATANRSHDMLVLGSARRRPLRRSGRAGVVGYCIDHAACSVLAVPAPPLAAAARKLARAPH